MDGSLQFGDLRSLLRVPADAPSILDLPTDRIGESDLQDVLWRDPSGIDILLAPPRVEMAEMVSVRDVEKSLSLLRRLYGAVVVDMPSALGDIPLALLDAADTILEIVTYDSTTIRNTLAVAEAFRSIGYPPEKVQYVVNRADSTGGIAAEDLARALGRVPEHTIVSDGKLVVQANNEGLPFVLADPASAISQDVARLAAAARRPGAGGRRAALSGMADPRPIGVFDSGVGGLTVLREIVRRLPGESTTYLGDNARAPYGTRPDDEVRRFSTEALDRLVREDVKALVVACNTSTAVALGEYRRRYALPVLGVIRPGAQAAALATRTRRVGRDRDAGHDPLPRLLRRDQGGEPGRRGLRARDARPRPARRGRVARRRRGGGGRRRCPRAAARRRGEDGEFIHPLPPSARIDTLLLGCTHYPLLRPILQATVGEGVAIVDSATATAGALAELLSVNGLEAPGSSRGTAAEAGAGHAAPPAREAPPAHRVLTTGDVAAFRGSRAGCSATRCRSWRPSSSSHWAREPADERRARAGTPRRRAPGRPASSSGRRSGRP